MDYYFRVEKKYMNSDWVFIGKGESRDKASDLIHNHELNEHTMRPEVCYRITLRYVYEDEEERK